MKGHVYTVNRKENLKICFLVEKMVMQTLKNVK